MVTPPDTTLRLTIPDELIEEIARRAAELALKQLQKAATSEPPYLTITEAAAYLRCKRQRIDDLLSKRTLRRFKDGRRTLILRTELDAYISNSNPAARTSTRSDSPRELLSPTLTTTPES
jgi:excisionase family DNA binding protein